MHWLKKDSAVLEDKAPHSIATCTAHSIATAHRVHE